LDSASLDENSFALLDNILKEISGRDSLDISINGHSDRSGESLHNRRLSLERAEAVRDKLTAQGVDPDLITVDYHGEGDPVVPTEDGVVEPRNRRVEVIVR
jgi:outer membrane protein OmpA-like peptidoglycan-associated protein